MLNSLASPVAPITFVRDLGMCLWSLGTADGRLRRRSSLVLSGYSVISPSGHLVACVDDVGLFIAGGDSPQQVSAAWAWGMAWSPDSTYLGYCTSEGIHILSVGGASEGRSNQLVREGNATRLAWSPDSDFIAFSDWEQGVFVMRPDGSDCQQVAYEHAGDVAWSPDSALVAYDTPGKGVALVNVATRERTQLTDHPEDGSPVWSPDGTTVAYTRWFPGEVRTVRTDGTNDRLIKNDQASAVRWSPDGTRVAYAALGRYNHRADLTVVDVSTGEQQAVSGGSSPVWVDNEQLAFLRWMGETVCTVDPEGKQTDLYTRRYANAVTSPDNQRVTYIDQNPLRLMVATPDGEHSQVLFVGETGEPMWLDNDRVGWISSDGVHISTVDGKQQHCFSVRSGWGDCCLIEPLFSPDGTHLVYASREGNIVVDTSGRSTVLSGSAPGAAVGWSPDSTHLAYATSEGMVVTDTLGRSTVLPGSAPGAAVAWSPDGTHIAYATRDGIALAAFPKGDTRHFPIGWEKSYRTLVWSPDSSRLVCYEPYVDEVPLVFVDLATGETRNVPVGFTQKVVWSPDSTRVARNTDSELLTISADDGRIQRIVSNDNIKNISWGDGGTFTGDPALHKR